MNAPRKATNFGCLGCFSVVCLTVFTIVCIVVLRWLDADWLDRLALWKPKPFPQDVIFSDEPASLLVQPGGSLAAEPAFTPLSATTADGIRLMQSRAVEVDYDPARGATLTSHEGATFEFPPGSIPQAAKIRAVPIASIPAHSTRKRR